MKSWKKYGKNMLLDQKGQTAIEYILLLLVMTSIITSIMMFIRTRYLGDPEKCASPAQQKLLLCKINGILEPKGEGKRFQYYPFKK